MSIASRLAARRSRLQLQAAQQQLKNAEAQMLHSAEAEVARVVARLTAEVRALQAPAGADGQPGPRGTRGPKGDKGDKGEKGDTPDHRWRGTALQFEKPDGSWGELVNLRGPGGPRGLGGGAGGGGLDPSTLQPLPAPALTTDQMIVVRGSTPYLATISLLQDIFGGDTPPPPPGAVTVNGEVVRVNGAPVIVSGS